MTKYTMQKTAKNILTLALLLSLAVAPTAFAQVDEAAVAPAADPAPVVVDPTPAPVAEVPAEVPTDTTNTADPVPSDAEIVAPADTTNNTESVNPQDTSTEVQDTTNTQQAAEGDALVQTGDPTATSTLESGSIIPLIYIDTATTTATTTDPAITPIIEATSTTVSAPVEPDPTPVEVVAPMEETPAVETPPLPVPQVTREELQPIAMVEAPEKPKFDFALTGKTVAAKKKVKNAAGEVTGETSVTTGLTSTIDNAEGVMQLSGQCTDTSYVVLLYKNQDDYLNDPRSYIVNSAYPCVNGAFSYGLSQLPSTLANGQYYLLIAQQGKTGGWSPITGVTEITINRSK